MPGIERNGEQRPGFPFKGNFLAGVVPYAGRAAAIEHEDHLLEELALRRELAARGDFADIAVVGGARSVVVHVDALAAAPRPRFELHGVEILHVNRRNNVEPFLGDPARVGGLFFRRKFLRQFVRYNGVFCHTLLLGSACLDVIDLTRAPADFHRPRGPAGAGSWLWLWSWVWPWPGSWGW